MEEIVRKTFFIALIVSLPSCVALAQVPTAGNVFFGYSFYNTNLSSIDRANTNGWEATLEGKTLPFLGIVADFSSHYGSQNFVFPNPPACPVNNPNCGGPSNASVDVHNYLFGPRASFSVGKFRPFAEGMIGVGHVHSHTVGSDTSFASALGGGIDYNLLRIVGWRFQGDYIHTHLFGIGQDNLRLSTGIVVRF